MLGPISVCWRSFTVYGPLSGTGCTGPGTTNSFMQASPGLQYPADGYLLICDCQACGFCCIHTTGSSFVCAWAQVPSITSAKALAVLRSMIICPFLPLPRGDPHLGSHG